MTTLTKRRAVAALHAAGGDLAAAAAKLGTTPEDLIAAAGRRMGRPARGQRVPVGPVYLTPDEWRAFRASVGAERELSYQEAIRRALRDAGRLG